MGLSKLTAAALAAGAAKGNFGAGAVLQAVSGYNYGKSTTNSASYVSLCTGPTITPSSTSSKILVLMNTSIFREGSSGNAYFAVYRNGTVSLVGANSVEHAGWWNDYSAYTFAPWSFAYLDSPNTTSPVNYQIMGKRNEPAAYAGLGGRGNDTDHARGVDWTLLEIAG